MSANFALMVNCGWKNRAAAYSATILSRARKRPGTFRHSVFHKLDSQSVSRFKNRVNPNLQLFLSTLIFNFSCEIFHSLPFLNEHVVTAVPTLEFLFLTVVAHRHEDDDVRIRVGDFITTVGAGRNPSHQNVALTVNPTRETARPVRFAPTYGDTQRFVSG